MRWLASTARRVVNHMCRNYHVFSRLQNGINGLRRRFRQRDRDANRRYAILNNVAFDETTGKTRKAEYMNTLTEGKTVCCVWERKLKPFAVKMVKVSKIKGSGARGGLAEVTLENGMSFRWTSMRTRHLFHDKERLANALEAPTRANVLIFTHGYEAQKHLREKGCQELGEGVDFALTEVVPEKKGE